MLRAVPFTCPHGRNISLRHAGASLAFSPFPQSKSSLTAVVRSWLIIGHAMNASTKVSKLYRGSQVQFSELLQLWSNRTWSTWLLFHNGHHPRPQIIILPLSLSLTLLTAGLVKAACAPPRWNLFTSLTWGAARKHARKKTDANPNFNQGLLFATARREPHSDSETREHKQKQ